MTKADEHDPDGPDRRGRAWNVLIWEAGEFSRLHGLVEGRSSSRAQIITSLNDSHCVHGNQEFSRHMEKVKNMRRAVVKSPHICWRGKH